MEKEQDDKVAVLEFELRKAYDTIKSLRGSLTEATGEGRSRVWSDGKGSGWMAKGYLKMSSFFFWLTLFLNVALAGI